MNPNLSRQEFAQIQIPGLEYTPPRKSMEWPEHPATGDPLDDPEYLDEQAHYPWAWGKEEAMDAANPLHSQDAEYDFARSAFMLKDGAMEGDEEFVPTWRISSVQDNYNPAAVEHQVRHADPLALREDPLVSALDKNGEEHFTVLDGNHRTLAAQRRGQLLMPARVMR
jgi:hypothetical protein